MQFPGTDESVLSGLMRGVAETRNRPAVIDMPVGGGHVVHVRDEPGVSLAESRRVQHAGQRDPALQRFPQTARGTPTPRIYPCRKPVV